jgi:hypothetical protein
VTTPTIPVSWGELLDKIAILQIKSQRLRTSGAACNAAQELALLRQVAQPPPDVGGFPAGVAELRHALLAVNVRLWRIEDRLREQEFSADFGPGFVALARAVYRENDERSRIKQALNRLLRSALVEEKQYPLY